MNRASGVAAAPYVPYTGELVAGVNPQQNQGIGGINSYAYAAQPAIQQAEGMATAAASPITQQQIQQYMSPYTQSVVNATQAQFNNQNQQQMQGVKGNAIAQGAMGGNREAVAEAELANQQQLAQAPVISGLMNQGYQTGLNTALTEQQALASGAYSLGNLGISGENAALTGANAQIGAGTLQQGTQQALDAALMQQFINQQAFPYQQAQWLAGIQTGVGSQMGGTSQGTTTAPPPSTLGQIAGLGTAGVGLLGGTGAFGSAGWLAPAMMGIFSDRRVKENIQKIGKLFDGQTIYRFRYKGDPTTRIGLIAQNVEHHHPDAVREIGGIKAVDYDAATKDAVRRWTGGGVANFDTGGGVAGMPYAGGMDLSHANMWIPQANMARGAGAPQARAPAPGPDQLQQQAQQVGALAKALTGAFKDNGPGPPRNILPGGVAPTTPNGGMVPTGIAPASFSPTDQSGSAGGIYNRGGMVRGYADGGMPDVDTADPNFDLGQPTPIYPERRETPDMPVASLGVVPPKSDLHKMFGGNPPSNDTFNSRSSFGLPTKGGVSLAASAPTDASVPAPTGVFEKPSWMAGMNPTEETSSTGLNIPLTEGIKPVGGISGAWGSPPVASPSLPAPINVAEPPGGVVRPAYAGRIDTGNQGPASVRANNPGAQYPAPEARKFGMVGYDVIGGGHQIAVFPSPVNGAAANMDLLSRNYTGHTVGQIGEKWTGGNGVGVPGYDPRMVVTKAMMDDPNFAIPFMKAIAGREAGHNSPLTNADWNKAHEMFMAGGDAGQGGDYQGVAARGEDANLPPTARAAMASGVAPPTPAQAARSGIDLSGNSKLWPSLIAAGGQMLASRSPHPGVALGEGITAGASAYTRAAELEQQHELKRSEIDIHAKNLQRQADQFQQELAHKTSHEGQLLQESKRQHDIQMGKLGLQPGYRWNAEGNQEFVPGGPHDPEVLRRDVMAKLPSTMDDASRRGAAEQYLKTGTFPPGMGRGNQGSADRNAIIADAYQLAEERGINPTDMPKSWQSFRSEQAGISRFMSGPQGNIIRSLNVATDHLDTLKRLGDALKNGNFPLFNELSQRWAQATGNSPPTNFDTAKQIIAPEVIKAIGVAGAGTKEERERMAASLSRASSPEQLSGAIDTAIRPLLLGQLNGLKHQFVQSTGLGADKFDEMLMPSTRGWITGKSSAPSSPSAAPVTPTPAPTVNLPTFASPADLQAAVAAGRIRSGDHFRTPDGRDKVVP